MKRPPRGGFTLIEVLLAIALISLLLGAMLTFIWDLLDRRTVLARGARDLQAGDAVVERMEDDLLAGLAGDAGAGAGIDGTSTRLRIMSRGVWLPVSAGSGVEATAGTRRDLQGSEYAFDPSSGRASARRWNTTGAAGGGGEGSMEVVSERVRRLRLRYYDGQQWRDSFNSLTEGGLPVAVEVAVWFEGLGREKAASRDSGDAAATAADQRWGEPDRLRVIVVPDGPSAAWRGS